MTMIGDNRRTLVDPKQLLLDYGELRDQADELFKAAHALEAAPLSDDVAEKLTHLGKLVSTHLARIEEARKTEKEAYLDACRTVDGFFKGIAHHAEEAKAVVTRRLGDFIKAERERKAAENWTKPEEEKAEVKTDYGVTAFARKGKLVIQVVDLDKVPRQYLMLNEAAVRAAVKGGLVTIPGLLLVQEEKVVVR